MSTISFRQFNHESKDMYPDITFCLEKNHLKNSIEEFQVSSNTFSNIMKGNFPLNMEDQNISKEIASLNSDLYFTDLKEILLSFKFTTTGNTTSYSKTKDSSKDGQRKVDSFFQTTYVDPDKKCFTRNSQLERATGIVRKEDEIALTFYSRLDETKLKIFLHHPGQFIRNIKSPIIDVTTKRENIAQKVILLISDVMNFKRRNKANEPCDERMTDDGENLRRKVILEVNCRPSYWSSFAIHPEYGQANIPFCSTPNELKKAYKQIQNLSNIVSSTQSCTEMFISSSAQSNMIMSDVGTGQIHLLIRYRNSHYQQIINSRDFDFDSMFSAIGGFVGIFMGYSLLQVTALLELSIVRNFRKGAAILATSFCTFFTESFMRGTITK